MTASKIEWTDRSDWNPLRGCTRVSPGCGGPGPHGGCYAEAIAARFSDPGQAFHGFAERTPKGGRWTGKVELIEDRLMLPLRWRKPAPGRNKCFPSSTSDIFHEALPDSDIDRIFGVMALARDWIFQPLTKRSARMRRYLNDPETPARIIDAALFMKALPENWWWPLPNVWLGVSVEDQERADERVPDLLHTPAAKRILSCEPLLGPLNLNHIKMIDRQTEGGGWETAWESALDGTRFNMWADDDEDPNMPGFPKIDQVIVGGESGPRARPMHPDWVGSLRDQCAAADVPFFFKQWGEWAPATEEELPEQFGQACEAFRTMCSNGFVGALSIESAFLHKPSRYPGCFPQGADGDASCSSVVVRRVGKGRAGRLLDGLQHDGMPA